MGRARMRRRRGSADMHSHLYVVPDRVGAREGNGDEMDTVQIQDSVGARDGSSDETGVVQIEDSLRVLER